MLKDLIPVFTDIFDDVFIKLSISLAAWKNRIMQIKEHTNHNK